VVVVVVVVVVAVVVVVVVVVLAHPTNKNLETIFLNIFKTNYIEN
jgi:ABC-type uncharacterized transport system permease subunit